jgi:4-amino-4-deoxy-L-arabinose transferase-like glycosyltransferase
MSPSPKKRGASDRGNSWYTEWQVTSWRPYVDILIVLLVIGAALRFDFMRATDFTIDGDEAIVGLMGKHILDGRGIPVFYYGQHYMGSLESIMASISFRFLGVNPFALQLVPLVWSVALIALVFLLGRTLFDSRAGLAAAALMAMAPPALLVWSSKARGGFIEVVGLGAIALWIMIAWLRSEPSRLRYPVMLGMVLGVGWWVNNQIIYFLLPIGFFAALYIVSPMIQGTSRFTSLRGFVAEYGLIIVCGCAAFLLGSLPYWWYNIERGFPSLGMFKSVDYEGFREHLRGLRNVALPMIVGAQRFWQKAPVFPYAKHVAVVLYLIPIGVLVCSRWRAVLGLLVGRIDRERPLELIVLFCVTCCGVFAWSSFGGLVQAPRYLLPLYVGVFLLVGCCVSFLMQRSAFFGWLYLVALLGFQITSSYLGGRAVSGEPIVFGNQRVARDHGPLIKMLSHLGVSKVRTNYWIGYRLAFETNEAVTFCQIGEPYQVRIPQYEQVDRLERELLPLVLVHGQAQLVKPALTRMGYAFSEMVAGEYVVLHGLRRLFPTREQLDLAALQPVIRASGSIDPQLAFDGKLETRWGTGAPQAPGQVYEIELPGAPVLDGVGYFFGQWWPDRPREFKVEIETPAGERKVILSPAEAKGALEVAIGEEGFVLRFASNPVKKVILSQLTHDRVFDWSIAEVQLFGPTPNGANDGM